MTQLTKLQEYAKTIHQAQKEKGFHDEPRSVAEEIGLVFTEVTEAFEAWRKTLFFDGDIERFDAVVKGIVVGDDLCVEYFKDKYKEIFQMEVADALIRVFDMVGKYNVDLGVDALVKGVNYGGISTEKFGETYANLLTVFGVLVSFSKTEDFDNTANIINTMYKICIHIAEEFEFDIYKFVDAKNVYNKTRAYRHGNKQA